MLHAISQINPLAVLTANVATGALAGVWFTKIVAKPYLVALGRSATPGQKPAPLFIIGPFLCSLVATFTSAVLINLLNIVSIEGAIGLGALIGVGYLVSTCMTIAINPNFPRPFLYTAINAPYFIVASLLSCAILVAMG